MAKDYTKYNIEGLGEKQSRRKLVFTEVKDCVEKNNPSFEDLQKAFPDEVQGSKGFIRKEALWTFINHFKHENMKITSILETFRKLKFRTLNVNFILLFSLIVVTSSAFGQDNDLTIEEFNYSNFEKSKNRTGRFSSYPIDKNDVKQIEYTSLKLEDNSIERLTKIISSSLKKLNSLGIVGKLTENNLSLTSTTSLKIAESSYGVRNISDGNLTIELSSIYRASIIVSKDNDTLILLPKEISVVNKYTSTNEDIVLLYYIDFKSLKNIFLQDRDLINDVLTLKKHISILKENKLELTESERKQFNKNIQTRIIKAINSVKLPKYYLVSVNRTEPAAQTKSYFYIVEKHSNNRFYSLGNEHDEFPVMDAVLNDQILVDTIQLIIDENQMRVVIRSTDYVTYFLGSGTGWARIEGNGQYSRLLGGPILNSSDTLFMTTSDGGAYSNMRNPLYLDNFPTYQEFSQKYLLDVRGKDFPLSKLGSRGYSIVENHIYSKDSISFAINIKKGQNSEPINSSYGGTAYGSNKKEIYDYAEQFHKFYKGWKQEVEEEKQKKELAAEQEKEQQKQELAKKYGRKYVDAMYELKIIVGMPEDLVNVIVNKLYTVGTSSSSNNGNYYRLEPRYGTGWVSVWIKNKKVTSVTYH